MRRALLILALLLTPVLSYGQADRALLLAPNGTLYSVESRLNTEASPANNSARYLTLSIQNESTTIKTNVPASLTGGNNWQPELAFDSDSNTLFVFWLRSQNSILSASELLFCSFQNGKWNTPSSIDDVPYHFRYNLRVGMTRSYQVTDNEINATRQLPGLSVHLAWWDESAIGETPRYAMLTIDKGVVTDIYRKDLTDFINTAYLRPFQLDDDSRETLRHPILFESPDHDTIDVVFGDMSTKTIHRLTLKPVLETRVRIPIGIRDTSYPAPRHRMTSDSRLSAVSTPPDRLVLYYVADGALRYLRFENGSWAAARSIGINADVNAEAAVSALSRLVRGD